MMTATVIPVEELVNLFYARQYAYGILRRFFIEEPSKEYLREFVRRNMIDVFPFKEDSTEIQGGIKDIKGYLAQHDVVNIDLHFQKLHWDFTRMFVGPFKLPVPPWESSYVRKDNLLFQGTTMKVRKKYEKYGFMVSEYNIEADDHIGLELDFIFHLNEFCIQCAESNNLRDVKTLLKEQNQFINEHLLKFIPQFSKLVINKAETQFYSGLAKILHGYLRIDSKVLQELLSIDISIYRGGK